MIDEPSNAVRLLADPLINRGTAFTDEDRTRLGLRGLLPTAVETLEQQVARAYAAFGEQPTDIAKHINLRALQDLNETLFYELLEAHIEEMLPIVYTPTVGVACQRFSEIYRRPRGLFVSYPDRERIGEVLRVLPWTIELTLVSLFIGILIGVPAGVYAATGFEVTPARPDGLEASAARRSQSCRSSSTGPPRA